MWFTDQAEEAARFYVSLFADSAITSIDRPTPDGPAFLVQFTLGGRAFTALNGGPHHQLTAAFSMMVSCSTQEDVDRLWAALTENGGAPQQCGWLTDTFGLSWQIVPTLLAELMRRGGADQKARVMTALRGMVKLDSTALQRAFDGDTTPQG